MEIVISDREAYEEDLATKKIVSYLSNEFGERDCICFYKYPPYNLEDDFVPNLILLDKKFGVIIFQIYGQTHEEIEEENDDSWIIGGKEKKNFKESLVEYKYLLESDLNNPRREISNRLNVRCFVCFPFLDSSLRKVKNQGDFKILYENFESENHFQNLDKNLLSEDNWKKVVSAIERLDIFEKTAEKISDPPTCLGEAIQLNNKKIMVFDEEQRESALRIPYGTNLIRGLAGTGKTIILAWKAAYLHYKYPNKKILYTFYTRSLYNQIEKLIKYFYKKHAQKGRSINWENLKVLHAWGGRSRPGVYYESCLKNDVSFDHWGLHKFDRNPFGEALKEVIQKDLKEEYDYILIDEAQDMPIEFIRLVQKIAKEPKNIVFGYDELQSTEIIEMGSFEELLKSERTQKTITEYLKEEDIILKKSYRNPMKVLHLAVALGFGIYNSRGIIQIIDNEENWKAIGYEIEGELKENQAVSIRRPLANSPNRIEDIYPELDSVNINAFKIKEEELTFVSNKIVSLIHEEKVRPEDIMVIELGRGIGKSFDFIRQELLKKNIGSKTPGFSDEADDFFVKDNVTLSTVRRAKGNEAPIVFIMGADNICSPKEDKVLMRINRSFAFIAISRSKGWCFITGKGENMDLFMEEYRKIMIDYPKFKFKFPTKLELEEMKKINYRTRDEKSKKDYNKIKDSMKEIIREIKENEYLPESLVNELKKSLESK